MKFTISVVFGVVLGAMGVLETHAQTKVPEFQPSTCQAVAWDLREQDDVPVHYASFPQSVASDPYAVTISFQGHSSYLIQSPAGVAAATDFAGWLVDPITPNIVTMNRAHSSHYTNSPDPKIEHVLKGWGDGVDIAKHYLTVNDMLVRNVTTDILRFGSVPDGNSIFIFETAGLCIGHLGHLHHKLSEDHYAKIGRLDIVMIPVDGGLTMTHVSAKEILKRLRSSIVLPMHVRSFDALPRFLSYMKGDFAIEYVKENKLVVSLRNLPKRPTVYLLPGISSYPSYDD